MRRGRSRTSPWQKIVQATLTLLLLFLIFGVVLPQIADWSDVWDALSSLTVGDAVLLIALFILIEVLKGAEQAVAIKPLSVTKAVVASEASSAVSNVVPGPSGTAMRLYIYRTWGLTSSDFAKGWLLTSIVNNAIILFAPSIALAIYAAQGDVSGKLVALAAIGAVLSLVCIGIAAGALHSERFAERVGAFVERLVTWARGIAHRPSDTDLAEVIVRFRADTIETVRGAGVTLVGVILLKYVATGVTLLVSLRAVGVPDDALWSPQCSRPTPWYVSSLSSRSRRRRRRRGGRVHRRPDLRHGRCLPRRDRGGGVAVPRRHLHRADRHGRDLLPDLAQEAELARRCRDGRAE